MSRLSLSFVSLFLASLLATSAVFGQGVLLVIDPSPPVPLPRPIILPRPQPEPVMSYKIKELSVQARLVDQVARVLVTQSFVNTGSRQMEVAFVFPLPYDGAVDQLTFMVDGKEYPGKLLSADEARGIYESYIRRNQDPALLEWIGTGMFRTSVFPVPPGAERSVSLRYNQLLRKDGTLTDFLFPLSTARYTSTPVEKVALRVSIESGAELTSVYSPTHSVQIERPGGHQAVVTYERQNEVPTNDFRLFFDVSPGDVGASVISYRPESGEDGYFLLLASPRTQPASTERPAKNVVCVFDRSGSMQGEKIQQAREALKSIINSLHEQDWFNIVAYDTQVESFRPELQPAGGDARQHALGFVAGLYAGGGTNIDGALKTVFAMLKDSPRPNYVIFLTDGQPTIGETNESKIVTASRERNQIHARLICVGVGYDVNSRLLDRLAAGNWGQSEFVRPNEDIQQRVTRLYDRMSAPVMTDVAVDFAFDAIRTEDGAPINRTYPQQLTDLFQGEQLVMVGRYRTPGLAKVTIRGTLAGQVHSFDFPAQLTESSPDETYGFVEKLWAMRRVGDLIDQLDLHGRNEELIKELVGLSTKHGILTPYTSFLADDQAPVGQLADARRGGAWSLERSREALAGLDRAEGEAGFAQRALKAQFKNAAQAPAEIAADEGVPVAGAAQVFHADRDQAEATDAVRQLGNTALYRRGNRLVTSDAARWNLEELNDKLKVIERFSPEYFELVRQNSPANNRALALQAPGEELLLETAGELVLVR